MISGRTIRIHAGHPRVTVDGPAFLLHDLLHLAGPLLVQTVHVQLAVQVVGSCCMQRANQPVASKWTGLPCSSRPFTVTHSARLEGEAVTGEGQAALFLLVRVRVSGRNLAQGQYRVDDAAARGNAVLISIL